MIINTTRVRVRYVDTDKMGIVHHARYLEWFEVGRTELLREIGMPYAEIEEQGMTLPVVEALCRYYRAARYDQIVSIRTVLKEIPRVRLKLFYEIFDENERLLGEGYTVHCFVNKKGRPTKVPDYFGEHFKRHWGQG